MTTPLNPRVNAIDVSQLDTELVSMIGQQVKKIFALFGDHPINQTLNQPELQLLADSILFMFTINQSKPTLGQKMNNVQLSDNQTINSSIVDIVKQQPVEQSINQSINGFSLLATSSNIQSSKLSSRTRLAYFTLLILVPYLDAKLQAHMTLEGWFHSDSIIKRSIYRIIQSLRNVLRIGNTVNFMLYLFNGTFLTLAHRLLGIKYAWLNNRAQRSLAFDVMHQQIAFTVLSEMFSFVLRLLPVTYIRRLFSVVYRMMFPSNDVPSSVKNERTNKLLELDAGGGCPLCGRAVAVNMQVTSPCSHSYCYYCIATHWQQFKPQWPCATCGENILGFIEWTEEMETLREETREIMKSLQNT